MSRVVEQESNDMQEDPTPSSGEAEAVLSAESFCKSIEVDIPRRKSSMLDITVGKFMLASNPSRSSRMRNLFLQCFSFACFALSNMLLPMILVTQMGVLDVELYKSALARNSLIVFIPCEIALFCHMVRNAASTQAVRAGSFQWIVYSWLISAKSWLLYFYVLHENGTQPILTYINRWLYFTPVFYCILTFRTLRQLFSLSESLPGGRRQGLSRDRHEHMTLDVVLLQDMVWHVVIDFIDINYMMFMANPLDAALTKSDKQAVLNNAEEFDRMRLAVGGFVFLALFFHQQSFPSCSVLETDKGPTSEHNGGVGRRSLTRSLTRVSHFTSNTSVDPGAAVDGFRSTRHTSTRAHGRRQEQIADVVKARKRSAIVSIILVDLPFFTIRAYMWSMSMSTRSSLLPEPPPQVSNVTAIGPELDEYGGRPMLDKWLVKNILCMLLQAMQLRFVQQADLERSQSLRWWERGGSRSSDAERHRTERGKRDPRLQRIWQDMGRSKLDSAFRDHAVGVQEREEEEEPINFMLGLAGVDEGSHPPSPSASAPVASDAAAAAASGGPPNTSKQSVSTLGADGGRREPRRKWHAWCDNLCCCCCCCCFRRRGSGRRGYCRFCSCDCGNSIILHAVMGLALGWLIAKVDFTQAFNDTVQGLGYKTT